MKKVFTLVALVVMFSLVACGPSAEEIAAKEKATQDSIAGYKNLNDVHIISIDNCEYIVLYSDIYHPTNIIHKYNCKNH